MPRGGRPSRTPALSAGPSTSSTPSNAPSRFSLLQETLEEDNQWDSDPSSGYSDYDYNARNSDGDTVASSMLPIFADTGGKKKPKKKKGKGKSTTPAPKTTTSSGGSKTPQQQKTMSEKVFTDEDEALDMPQDMIEMIVRMAVIKVMEGHFAKLYSKINNLKTEVSTLKTTIGSLVEENKKLGEVRGNVPDQAQAGGNTIG